MKTLPFGLTSLTAVILLSGCQQAAAPLSSSTASLGAQSVTVQVESKWTLRDDQAAAARSKLNLYSSNAEQRTMYFYDTWNLDLYRQGLIMRARKVKDGDDESTVKFRPMTVKEAGNYLNYSGFKCEIDAVGTNQVSSCSFSTVQPTGQIDAVRDGFLSIKSLFSSNQEAFATLKVPVNWSTLQVLGPTPAQVWKKSVSSLAYPYTVEQWTLPSGAVVTEVSTRTSQADASSSSVALKNYLMGKGLVISTDQETKTQRTLNEWTQ
ncbi:hypothetical protein [Deinococcus sp.]|uniref:hypothetical protein n=1 Tax=Deinococcus sp. TaxID=47478 RepID=UPI0025BB9E30|nr:hypothetical protein [Deinococcus sp.]